MDKTIQQKAMDARSGPSHEESLCSPRKKCPDLEHKPEPEVFVTRFPEGWAYCVDGTYSAPIYASGVLAWEAAERVLEAG